MAFRVFLGAGWIEHNYDQTLFTGIVCFMIISMKFVKLVSDHAYVLLLLTQYVDAILKLW